MIEKISGGFVLVNVASLLHAWRTCRSTLGIGDFRAWMACHEMVARRCTSRGERIAAFQAAEVAHLCEVGERRTRKFLKNLVAAGLLDFSESEIRFPEPGNFRDLPSDTIGGGLGNLTIPRRLLRFMAAGARPALIATVMGILLRCISRKKGGWSGRGRVKSSWVAENFGISLRQAISARGELVELGWITTEDSSRWSENRWGRVVHITLTHQTGGQRDAPASVERSETRSSHPPAENRASSSHLESDPDLSSRRIENQEPAEAGVSLSDIKPADLQETSRTLQLFDQAVAAKLVGPSECDRLKFLAAAEHARTVATKNASGMFAKIVRAGLWNFLTHGDEISAAKKLREHLHGDSRREVENPKRKSTFIQDEKAGPSDLASILQRLAMNSF